MLTKEEVAEIITYCNEHNERYKKRLEELGIPAWSFYDSKRNYVPEEDDCGGEFLQLMPGQCLYRESHQGKPDPTKERSAPGGKRSGEHRIEEFRLSVYVVMYKDIRNVYRVFF